MDHADIFKYVVIPVLIFLARVTDVSIGTLRIILISRGNKIIAPLLGFVEVTIWLIAITQVMKNLNHPISYLAYGAGFAFGNYVGMWLEGKIAMGYQSIRVITNNPLEALPMVLRDEGYAVTTVKGRGAKGSVNVIFTVVSRKNVNHVLDIAQMIEPMAFVTVEDIRLSHSGYFKPKTPFPLAKKK
ncbi:DUF2179 domain-containing protein [candidate division KSB1 bacterium]|nr:DUF2179 domain-containing protein [candidate division KSB1 bacterium]